MYLSSDSIFDPDNKLICRVENSGALPSLGSYSETLTAALPGVVPGGYHIFAIADSRGVLPDLVRRNNTLASASTIAIDIPTLTFGGATTGTIRNGQDFYFRLNVPGGLDIQLAVSFGVRSEAEPVVWQFIRFSRGAGILNYEIGLGCAGSGKSSHATGAPRFGRFFGRKLR